LIFQDFLLAPKLLSPDFFVSDRVTEDPDEDTCLVST